MTQLLRWAVFERKLWSGVSVEDVKKNTLCLVKDKDDWQGARLQRARGRCQTKDEFVQYLTQTCIDYEHSFRVAAA